MTRIGSRALVLASVALAISLAIDTAKAQVVGAGTCGAEANMAASEVGNNPSVFPIGRVARAVTCLINAERTSRGLPALATDASLSTAALMHASEAGRLKWWVSGADPHVNPQTGSTIASRLNEQRYCPSGARRFSEIAYTWAGDEATPVGAVNWWMNISTFGHREAILDPAVKELGVGASRQVADRNVALQSKMGTYVVNFGACP